MPSNIPWQPAEEWNQVLLSFNALENKGKDRLTKLFSIARKIQKNFELMADPMEKLCADTCVNCEDICCLRATIWFDFKDLLYIYCATGKFPESQIKKVSLKNKTKGCHYFTEKGCILSRIKRPFVCTWYFCPTQKEYLKLHYPNLILDFDRILSNIKELRNKIEEEFVCISADFCV